MINNPDFQIFYKQYVNQSQLDQLILEGNRKELLKIYKVDQPIECMTIGDLRKMAKRLGITYYYNMTRPSLLSEISNAVARENANSNSL